MVNGAWSIAPDWGSATGLRQTINGIFTQNCTHSAGIPHTFRAHSVREEHENRKLPTAALRMALP